MRDGIARIVGAGMSMFGDRPTGARDLFVEAFQEALDAVSPDAETQEAVRRRIGEAYIGNLGVGGAQLGNPAAWFMEHVGLAGVPARRVENACASSGFAFRDAVRAVTSGATDVAVAAGVEKMNDLRSDHKRYWLGVSGDTEWERTAGLTFPGVYALMADRHMHEYGTTKEHLAAVAVKNHENGALNPKAQFRKPITLEKALSAPTVAAPLGLFDCCATTDGASVVIVANERGLKGLDLDERGVFVVGSGAATDHLAIHDRPSLTQIPATGRALAEAERGANAIGVDWAPERLDMAEVHDCFTIAEILAVEGLGLCPPGSGGAYTADGATARTSGEGPAVNPSGGLKAKGHPLGATGTAQVVEAFLQLGGRAGDRQVPDAQRALTHNVGGSGATATVHLFATEEGME